MRQGSRAAIINFEAELAYSESLKAKTQKDSDELRMRLSQENLSKEEQKVIEDEISSNESLIKLRDTELERASGQIATLKRKYQFLKTYKG